MPNWKKVIVSGSSAQLNHITASGNIKAAGNLTTGGALDVALTGYITASHGSDQISGSETAFDTQLNVGDAIKIVSSSVSQIFTVSSIKSNTSMSIDSNWSGTSWDTGSAYSDSDLFTIKDGDDKTKLTVDKSGDISASGDLSLEGDITASGKLIVGPGSSDYAGDLRATSIIIPPNSGTEFGLIITGSTNTGRPLLFLGQSGDDGEFILGRSSLNKDSFIIRQEDGGAAQVKLFSSHSQEFNSIEYARFTDPMSETQGSSPSWVNYSADSASTSYFGIGTNNPSTHLHVSGNIKATGTATFGTSTVVIDGPLGTIVASGDISSSGTGSFGHLMVGGGNFTSTSLAAGGGGSGFPFAGAAVITGSMLISGSESDEPLLTVEGNISASGNIYGAMFKVPFGGYARTTTVNNYYVKTYGGGYHYYSTNLGNTIGSETFYSANRYAQYIAEGGEKVNKVNGWISPRRQAAWNTQSASMYLWKATPTNGAGSTMAYTQLTPSQSFAGHPAGYSNWRIDMDVHQDSRSLSDGDVLIFGIKRTGFGITTEYYDFNGTIELEK